MIQHPVLRQKRAHHLTRDDERNKQRPAIQPAQHGDSARIFTQRQITGDRDRDHADQHGRQEDDPDREQEIGAIQIPRLGEMLERELAGLAAKRKHRRHRERQHKEYGDDGERRPDERVGAPISVFCHTERERRACFSFTTTAGPSDGKAPSSAPATPRSRSNWPSRSRSPA